MKKMLLAILALLFKSSLASASIGIDCKIEDFSGSTALSRSLGLENTSYVSLSFTTDETKILKVGHKFYKEDNGDFIVIERPTSTDLTLTTLSVNVLETIVIIIDQSRSVWTGDLYMQHRSDISGDWSDMTPVAKLECYKLAD